MATVGAVSAGLGGQGAGVAAVRRKPLPPAGTIRLRAATFGFVVEVTGELDEPVKPTGYGGHGVIARPGQIGLTVVQGRDPGGLLVVMSFDRRRARQSVEGDIAVFETLAGVQAPALPLVVEGRGIPHSFSTDPSGRWVITDDVSWGDSDAAGKGRTMQQVAFSLLRLSAVDPDAIDDAVDQVFHTVAKGSELKTLTRIARHYGTTWFRLRKLNSDLPAQPDRALKPGTRVRLA
jgi:hypothetical protein